MMSTAAPLFICLTRASAVAICRKELGCFRHASCCFPASRLCSVLDAQRSCWLLAAHAKHLTHSKVTWQRRFAMYHVQQP